MRAVILADPVKGPGYGIIQIYDLANAVQPQIIIKRMSDSKTLAEGGWQAGSHSRHPANWDNQGNSLVFSVGPEVIDNLTEADNYELTLVGIGTCPLQKEDIFQSKIINDDGAGMWPPPPETPSSNPDNSLIDNNNVIYEGVEKTPGVMPDIAASGDLAGVAAGPDNAIPSGKRRGGCFLLSLLILCVWLAGGWLLYHASLHTPTTTENDNSQPFKFIPD